MFRPAWWLSIGVSTLASVVLLVYVIAHLASGGGDPTESSMLRSAGSPALAATAASCAVWDARREGAGIEALLDSPEILPARMPVPEQHYCDPRRGLSPADCERAGVMKRLRLDDRPPTCINELGNGRTERVWKLRLQQNHVELVRGKSVNGKDTVFCRDQPCEFFMVNEQVDLSGLPPVDVIGFQALVSQVPSVLNPGKGSVWEGTRPASAGVFETGKNSGVADAAIAHHMDLFLCTSAVSAQFPTIGARVPRGWEPADEAACDQMIWAYDRGATQAFRTPPSVGFRIGAGTPYSRLLLQWHYIMPEGGSAGLHGDGVFRDRSGFELSLTPDLRQHSAATLAVMDMTAVFHRGSPTYHHTYNTTVASMHRTLWQDFDKSGGKLTPFAVHLHMHDHGTAMWTNHFRAGAKIGEYGRIRDYSGYGTSERFNLLAPFAQQAGVPRPDPRFTAGNHFALEPGDTLGINCVMNTQDPTIWSAVPKRLIKTEMANGDEMCGILLMYYPHDPTARFRNGSMIGSPGRNIGQKRDEFVSACCWNSSGDSAVCHQRAAPIDVLAAEASAEFPLSAVRQQCAASHWQVADACAMPCRACVSPNIPWLYGCS